MDNGAIVMTMRHFYPYVIIVGICVGCGVSPTRKTQEQAHAQQVERSNLARPHKEHASRAPAVKPAPKSCADRNLELDAERQKLFSQRPCNFSVDCIALTAAQTEIEEKHCPSITGAGCEAEGASCQPDSVLMCKSGQCRVAAPDAELDEAAVPNENKVGIDPPPRPPAGDAEQRARQLLSAIVADEPALAADFFFPQEAFRKVKAMAKPDRYWRKLFARYQKDIHALHEQLGEVQPDNVHFERLEVVRRGGFVRRGEEGNALPYWAARHNRLHYTRDGRAEKIEVRVLITWGRRWYITHLSEFH